jgi:mannitol/fructose-specific phosphotransferase system IIA component (Ntr-type)
METTVSPIATNTPFTPDLFFPALDVGSKEELFAVLVDALVAEGVAQHRAALLKLLLEREALGTTAIGHGAAIPHARSTVVGAAAVTFARIPRGVDFAARGRAPVRFVLLIVAPYGRAGDLYQPLLAAAVAAARDDATRHRLLAVDKFEDFAGLMRPFMTPPLQESFV